METHRKAIARRLGCRGAELLRERVLDLAVLADQDGLPPT